MMVKKKYTPAHLIFLAIILSVFAGPFIYRVVKFYKELSEFDYQEFPAQPKLGEQVKSILEFSSNNSIKVYRNRRWYYGMWNRHQISDKIVAFEAPSTLKIHDKKGMSLLLQTSDKEIFTEILEAGRSSESTDSLILYILEEKEGKYSCFEVVKGLAGRSETGNKLNTLTLKQFLLDKQEGEIADLNTFLHNMDFEERMEKKAPALLFNSQKKMKGQLVFGKFEVIETNPLTVKCISYISDKHSDELKKKLWSKWFSGLDLLLWILFFIFFGISMFFVIKAIGRILKGRPID